MSEKIEEYMNGTLIFRTGDNGDIRMWFVLALLSGGGFWKLMFTKEKSIP